MKKMEKTWNNIKYDALIDKHNWEGINYPSEKYWEIHPAYVSNYNSNVGKQIILLIIPNGEGWHYIAYKSYLHY